jgi:hypothetical protein
MCHMMHDLRLKNIFFLFDVRFYWMAWIVIKTLMVLFFFAKTIKNYRNVCSILDINSHSVDIRRDAQRQLIEIGLKTSESWGKNSWLTSVDLYLDFFFTFLYSLYITSKIQNGWNSQYGGLLDENLIFLNFSWFYLRRKHSKIHQIT